MRVLVTGGASGIGRAIADAFVEAGDAVHVADIQEPPADARFTSSIADCADPAAVDGLFGDVDRTLGGLDVLVNNVGIAGPTGPIEGLDAADWRRTLDVNIGGHFLCAQQAVPRLREAGGGSIVNISSTAGVYGYPLRAPYAVSKWGVIGLTKSLAMELGDAHIRVNAICPGPVDGPRMEQVIEQEAAATGMGVDELRAAYANTVSMRSFIDATDVAATVLFLCSDSARLVSGQVIAVDGHTETLRTDR